MKAFTQFIAEEHPDPDSLLVDEYVFEELCKLAEAFLKAKVEVPLDKIDNLLNDMKNGQVRELWQSKLEEIKKLLEQ